MYFYSYVISCDCVHLSIRLTAWRGHWYWLLVICIHCKDVITLNWSIVSDKRRSVDIMCVCVCEILIELPLLDTSTYSLSPTLVWSAEKMFKIVQVHTVVHTFNSIICQLVWWRDNFAQLSIGRWQNWVLHESVYWHLIDFNCNWIVHHKHLHPNISIRLVS